MVYKPFFGDQKSIWKTDNAKKGNIYLGQLWLICAIGSGFFFGAAFIMLTPQISGMCTYQSLFLRIEPRGITLLLKVSNCTL